MSHTYRLQQPSSFETNITSSLGIAITFNGATYINIYVTSFTELLSPVGKCELLQVRNRKKAKLNLLASGAGPHEGKGHSQKHLEVHKKKDGGKTTGRTNQSLTGRGSRANCGQQQLLRAVEP